MKLRLTLLICMCAAVAGAGQTTLKEAFKNDFLVGVALNEAQYSESNPTEAAIAKAQFNSISPENCLKWKNVHPEPGRFDFTLADRYVAFGQTSHMFIIGHNLIWHRQTPDWVFRDAQGNPAGRDLLLARMREHIFTVVGRYKGKIGGWDVVNEALNEDGTLRDSPWRKIIGDDYLAKAFVWAHQADPGAELYYNDFALENEAKRAGAKALITKLRSQGVFISAIGLQGHYGLEYPSLAAVDDTISAFDLPGLKVMITELDLDVLPTPGPALNADILERQAMSAGLNPYPNGLPDAVQQRLAQRYADLFGVFLKHRRSVARVTLWGVTDGNSWLDDWPVAGRTSYPLLFDRAGRPKPAFYAVLETAKAGVVTKNSENQPPPAR